MNLPIPPPPPVAKLPLWRRTPVRIAAAAFVVLVAIGAVTDDEPSKPVSDTSALPSTTVESSETTVEESTTTTRPPTTTTTRPPTTTTTVDTEAVALIAWTEENLPRVIAVGDGFNAVAEAAGNGDTFALRSACSDLADLVDEAQLGLPVPVDAIDRPYRAALDTYEEATTYCILGADSFDADMIGAAADLFSKGADLIAEATEAMSRYAPEG